MKKKFLLLSTIFVLSTSLWGCSSEKEDDTVTVVPPSIEDTYQNYDLDIELPADRGYINDGIFTNAVFELSFPVQDDWLVCTDLQALQILDLSTDGVGENDIISASNYEERGAGSIYDIVFYFSDQQSNVIVSYINSNTLPGFDDMTLDEYAEGIETYLLSAQGGASYTINDRTVETYGGREYTCINVSTNIGFEQKMLLRKCNGYMITVTLTYFPETEAEMQAYLDSFIEVE